MMHARPLNWAERHVGAQNAFTPIDHSIIS